MVSRGSAASNDRTTTVFQRQSDDLLVRIIAGTSRAVLKHGISAVAFPQGIAQQQVQLSRVGTSVADERAAN
jgi:hypothetical protein